ncbi:hypothetical protein FF011L_35060 [Roseimaritima multifibrata]|uniref:Uncharacterized protein n=1 Tax=Roseimaritima multifibrata TaxID=1930274 RepID=A0A517MIK4_9BACT|nr:hypothetical protein [Roseimaritima multifibrata]QDS94725.1 hypothetical protein FF011L_35060 [Roseimaritima multifibrata]
MGSLLKTVTLMEVMKMPREARGEGIDPNAIQSCTGSRGASAKRGFLEPIPLLVSVASTVAFGSAIRIEFLASVVTPDCLTFSIMNEK